MTAEEITEPYDRILQNMREYPNDIPIVGGDVSEAFRGILNYYLHLKKQKLLNT